MNAGRYIRCAKCGDYIRSMHRHDFVPCRCGETFVDGGSDYLRCGGAPEWKDERTIRTWARKPRDQALYRSGSIVTPGVTTRPPERIDKRP